MPKTAPLLLGSCLALVLALVLAGPARADQVVLDAAADNTLYESATGSRSNGAGDFLFAGKNNDGLIRRGLVRFDLSAIPPGSSVSSAQLRLNMSRTQAGTVSVGLHRVLAAWGEGSSNAGGEEGGGAASTPGDATWIHTTFSTATWAAAGGDFAAAASATLAVAGTASYTWGSSAGMVADAQAWVDSAASNHGWLLRADESAAQTAKRFDSRTHPGAAGRPQLTVVFTPPAQPGACCDASGGCSSVLQAACAGSFQGAGTACGAGGTCGACCDGAACAYAVDLTCTAYQGDGSSCTPDPCVVVPRGACCTAGGCVASQTAAECAALAGTYRGDGTTCTPDPCVVVPRGACCAAGGCVASQTAAECAALAGTYRGDGTTCTPDPCVVVPRGACCAASGCSEATTEAECVTLGGIWQGEGQTCATDPCGPDSRACCLPGDTCTVMNRDVCRATGGDDQDGTCNPNTCGRGACCLPAGCVDGLRGRDCVGVGGTYQGPGSTCAISPCAAPCSTAAIQPLVRLLAVKRLGVDVVLSWTPDPAADGYNTWFVTRKSDIPAANEPSGLASGVPGCHNTAPAACTHVNAVPAASGPLLHYNAIGTCAGSEAAR